ALERNPLFPDVPVVAEFAKDERTRKILQLFVAPQAMDRPILAPPEVQAERIATLRRSFHATVNDPSFIAEAQRQHLEIAEVDGARLAKIVADAYALPPDIVKAAVGAMNVATTGGSEKGRASLERGTGRVSFAPPRAAGWNPRP